MPKNQFYALLAVMLAFVSEGLAQATVTGLVKDNNDEIVIGAYITNGSETVATDFEGNYSITLPAGIHTLKCSFIGMATIEKQFDLKDGDAVQWSIQLSPEAKALDMAVVSAGRFEQSVAEVTVSMEILQPALVENKATTSLESAIEQTPGVSLVDGEPQIRSGSGFSYGAGSRVMVLVDDMPVLSGDAGRPTWGFLPLENLEQIEVIKGASSVLYGSAALSGVINVRTRYPDARPLTRITLQHGAYANPRSADSTQYWDNTLQQSNIRFLHSRQLGGWDIVIGGNLLGNDGFKGPEILTDSLGAVTDTVSTGYNPLNVDRFDANKQARFNLNIRRRESKIKGLRYGLSTNWQKGESLNTLLWDNSSTGLYSSYAGAATRTKQLVGTVDPFVEYMSESGVKMSFRNRWQHLVNDNSDNKGNSSDVFYSELQAQKTLESGENRITITYGAVRQKTFSEADLYMGGNEDGINTAENLSFYNQIDQTYSKLNISTGIRYEQFTINDKTESKPVFRAGTNYQLAEETYLRGSFGQGFRFPTIAEKFIRTGLGDLQIYPNTDLRPEFSTNIEAGIKQGVKVGGFMGYLDVAVFEQKFEDFVEFTFGQWGDVFTDPMYGLGFRSMNTGESRVRGAEASLMGQAKFGKNNQHTIDVIAGYTYTNPISLTPDYNYNQDSTFEATYLETSFDTTNYILKYRSQHLVRFDAQWTHPRGFVGVSARYQSMMQNFDKIFYELDQTGFVQWGLPNWLDANPTLPWIVDMRVGWELSETQKVSIVASNIFNKEYAIRPMAIEAPRLVNLVYTYEL